MIFCDLGVNPTPWGHCVYDDIIEKLAASGIPRNQIAAIGDADSDAKKQALFDRVRNGSVRVLIGSTQKMGTGTNVQKRLAALHHLDAPWKPAEVEQREGRILRQGNGNAEVAIYRYVTEGSFDAYMWQALETKARFIAQVMSGQSAVRRAEDIGGQELSYAEVKAIASGNPAVLTLAEADAEIQKLAVLRKNHADEQYLARRSVRDLSATIDRLESRVAGLAADMATAAAHAHGPVTIGSRLCSREDAIDLLGHRLKSLPGKVHETRRFPLGAYRGLNFGIVLHHLDAPEAYLEGAVMRHAYLSRDSHGPRAVLNALDRLIGSYDSQAADAAQDLAIAQGQLRDYEARPRPALRPCGVPGGAHDRARPAQGRALRRHPGTRLGAAAADERTGRADQGAEIRPQHRAGPATRRRPPHCHRGAGHHPPPPEDRLAPPRADRRAGGHRPHGGADARRRPYRPGRANVGGNPSLPGSGAGRDCLPRAGRPRPAAESAPAQPVLRRPPCPGLAVWGTAAAVCAPVLPPQCLMA